MIRVLFSNPPWHHPPENGQGGWRGVRAGSRWPHTFEYYSHEPEGGLVADLVGGYIPFPFWLATATALAQREGIDATLRDSIALGETYDNFYDFVTEYAPRVMVVETSTATVAQDLDIVRELRRRLGELIVIFTGLHVEIEREEFLRDHAEIDYLVYGEYERSVVNLLKVLEDGGDPSTVGGMIYRVEEEVRKTEFGPLVALDELPWPLREGLPEGNYFDGVCGLERPQLQVMATRGCPYGCIFCIWPQMFYRGKSYRKRSPKDVVDEIEYQMARYPYRSFYIDDDTFNIDRKYVIELARLIKERGLDRYRWGTMGRADLADQEQIDALKEAGLYSVKYGVESAEQGVLDEIDKRIDLDKVIAGIRRTKEAGIKVHLTYTIGLPSDTVDTIERTIDLACELPSDTVQFSIATPYPGTKMYDIYDEKGWLSSKRWEDYVGSTKAVSRTDTFNGEQLEFYVREGYRRFTERQLQRTLASGGFPERFKQRLAEDIAGGGAIVVLQSARIALTRYLVGLLSDWGVDVHVMTHQRFAERFADLLSAERIHAFDQSGDFNYEQLKGVATELRNQYGFRGAVVPYSNLSGGGYSEVELVAKEVAGRIIAGVNFGGEFL